jgi:type IV fimbrial biogenesis protein FimT
MESNRPIPRIVGEWMMGSLLKRPYLQNSGFSLVELLMVISISAILLAVGIPGFGALINKQRVVTTANDFFMSISLTRSEAIRRGARVDMAPIDGTDWAKGWVVFVDKNNNQIQDSGDETIAIHQVELRGMTIQSGLTDSSRPYLAYNGTGRTRTNSSSQTPQLGTISFTLDGQVRRIKLNFLGRPRLCNPDIDNTCTGSADSN